MSKVDGSMRKTCRPKSKLLHLFIEEPVPEKPQDHISLVTDTLASSTMSTNDGQPEDAFPIPRTR